MDGLNNIVDTIKYIPKKMKIIIASVLGMFLLVVIVAVIASNKTVVDKVAPINIADFEDATSMPKGYRSEVERSISDIIKKNSETSGLVFSDAIIRDGTYKEEAEGDAVKARLIVDIDSLHYSFEVEATWPKNVGDGEPVDPDVVIKCPHYLDVIYTDTKCIAQSPQQQLRRYLPHYGRVGDVKYAVDFKRYVDKTYLRIEIPACSNVVLLEEAKESVKKWLKTIYLDPNDYEITTINTCGG